MQYVGIQTLALMQRDPNFLDYALRCELDPNLFFQDLMERELGRLMLDLGKQFKAISDTMLVTEAAQAFKVKTDSDPALKAELKTKLKLILEEPYPDLDWIQNHFEEEMKLAMFRAAVKQSVNLLNKNDAKGVSKLWSDTLERVEYNSFQPTSIVDGLDLISDYASLINSGEALGVPTGIPELDDILFWKGLGYKELTMVLAPPKRGKTMFMIWLAYAAIARGYNVLYITLEVSKTIIWMRLASCKLQAHIDELIPAWTSQSPHFETWLNGTVTTGARKGQPRGNCAVVDIPTKGASAADVRAIVKSECRAGRKPDLVCVDYAKLLRHGGDTSWEGLGESVEHLRGTAKEFDLAMVSGAQGTRATVKKKNLGHDDFGYDFSQAQTADTIVALGKRPDEVPEDATGRPLPIEMDLILPPCRNNASGKIKVTTAYHQGRFFCGPKNRLTRIA